MKFPAITAFNQLGSDMNTDKLRLFRVALAAGFLAWAVATPASANIFTVTGVTQGCFNGYCSSGFHAATPASPMSGSGLASITGVTGTYDGRSGALDVELTSNALGFSGRLHGTLQFPTPATGGGFLASRSFLQLDTSDTHETIFFGLLPDQICCSGDTAPNSLVQKSDSVDPGLPWFGTSDDWLMTLWAADVLDPTNWITGTDMYPDTEVGLDLRISLFDTGLTTTSVPIAPSGVLLVLGALALCTRRRRAS